MVGNLKVGDQIRQTHSRFEILMIMNLTSILMIKNMIQKMLFSMVIFIKKNTPQFNKVNRSHYGNGSDFNHETIENRGTNCFIPTKGYCFVKCNNFLTGQEYKQQYLDFFRKEKKRSNIMTKAGIQPFCKANNNNLGYYDGERVFPRSVTQKNNSLFLYNNHFCLIWKSECVSFNLAIEELKENFKIVDNFITEENVNSHFKYELDSYRRKLNLI